MQDIRKCPVCERYLYVDELDKVKEDETVACWDSEKKVVYELCNNCNFKPMDSKECKEFRKEEGFVKVKAKEVFY